MNLNLGLESLNGANTTVYRNTENNSILFNACDNALGEMVASIENLFDAAKNAVAIRKALKQYGKTQSIVALVGQEGLATAQSFSMEGFWRSVKEFLVKIWTKICEWWNRFWSIFFSNEKKMQELSSTSGTLERTVEYDGVNLSGSRGENYFDNILEAVKADIPVLKEKVEIVSGVGVAGTVTANSNTGKVKVQLKGFQFTASTNMSNTNGADRGTQIGFDYVHVVLRTIGEVKARAKILYKLLKKCSDLQKKIDETSKKALDNAKKMKDAQASEETADGSKTAAKYMRSIIQQVYRVLNTEAAKLSAHTSIKH